MVKENWIVEPCTIQCFIIGKEEVEKASVQDFNIKKEEVERRLNMKL